MITAPPVVDIRAKVARQTGVDFARRSLTDIRGVVLHQELGGGDVYSVARYHTSPECHIAPGKGCPSICYTFFVDYDGSILQVNDLEAVTWSQGGHGVPVEGTKANTNFLAVCFRGDFSGVEHEGKADPTPAQVAAAGDLWRWLRDSLDLPAVTLYGHHDFGKPACPGFALTALIETLRAEPDVLAALTPLTVEEWQRALVRLGYDLGRFGPELDGVDGEWGGRSAVSLVAFQRSRGVPRTGLRDAHTARQVAHALQERGITLKPSSPESTPPKAPEAIPAPAPVVPATTTTRVRRPPRAGK